MRKVILAVAVTVLAIWIYVGHGHGPGKGETKSAANASSKPPISEPQNPPSGQPNHRALVSARLALARQLDRRLTPIRYRATWPFGPADDALEDRRRNLWEELQSYIEAAKLSEDQRLRFLNDLTDLAEIERVRLDARALPTTAQLQLEFAEMKTAIEERMGYLTEDQWTLLRKRFWGLSLGLLPYSLASMYVLEVERTLEDSGHDSR